MESFLRRSIWSSLNWTTYHFHVDHGGTEKKRSRSPIIAFNRWDQFYAKSFFVPIIESASAVLWQIVSHRVPRPTHIRALNSADKWWTNCTPRQSADFNLCCRLTIRSHHRHLRPRRLRPSQLIGEDGVKNWGYWETPDNSNFVKAWWILIAF